VHRASTNYWNKHVIRAAHFSPDCECIAVLVLNTRHRIRGHTIISVGTLNEALACPREIYRIAVMAAAHSVILMHNHPSGEVEPSEADRRLTRKVKESGEILGIQLIVGHQRYFSFRESGLV
jgi:DNA repair protein RadC